MSEDSSNDTWSGPIRVTMATELPVGGEPVKRLGEQDLVATGAALAEVAMTRMQEGLKAFNDRQHAIRAPFARVPDVVIGGVSIRMLTGDERAAVDATIAQSWGVNQNTIRMKELDRGEQARDTIARLVQERDDARQKLLEILPLLRKAQRAIAVAGETERLPEETLVDRVVRDLTARRVSAPDVKRLGDAIDVAKAPIGGRAGADEALGRATSRLVPVGIESLRK